MRKYRLVTRSDFDGLVCAMLLKDLGLINEITFAHPKDVQDGAFEITDNDITANLPYAPGAHLAFDHHYSEIFRNVGVEDPNYINIPNAPSAARVVYDYYGGKDRFPGIAEDMLSAVDRADSARFSRDDVLAACGWNLLSFIMDSRTGLGRFKSFAVSNYNLMTRLIEYCRTHPVEEILELPDVKERVDLYLRHRPEAEAQIKRCAVVHGPLVVLDLREEEPIYCANRFLIYALFPQANISMHVLWGRDKGKVVFAVGKSIFRRTSRVDIDTLMLRYGGGGHEGAGTCQALAEGAARVQGELIAEIRRRG